MVRPAQPRRAAGRAEVSNGTRQRILHAARELFARHGYAGTSVRMIARHCGMSDPAIHYHFRSKSDIYEALLVEPEYGSPVPQGAAARQGIAEFVEQRFWWWAGDAELIRLLLREQLRGRPDSINYLLGAEQRYRAELAQVAQAVYGEGAGTIADLAWYLLAGVLWDVVVAYGSEAQDIIEQDYFRMRVRHLINTALDAVDPLQP